MISRAANRAAAKTLWRASSRSSTNRMASTLVISEPLEEDGSTPAGTQSTVTAATQLNNGNDIHLLVVGGASPSKIPEGVSKVLHVPIDDKLSETVANAVLEAADDDCNVVLGTASKFGSTVVPRAAALLDVSPVTDILEIEDESELSRILGVGLVKSALVGWCEQSLFRPMLVANSEFRFELANGCDPTRFIRYYCDSTHCPRSHLFLSLSPLKIYRDNRNLHSSHVRRQCFGEGHCQVRTERQRPKGLVDPSNLL